MLVKLLSCMSFIYVNVSCNCSAYCGGLWVAALSAASGMARTLGFHDDEKEFSKLLEQARKSYEDKLWSGSYYRFDTRACNRNVVMADQLAGHW